MRPFVNSWHKTESETIDAFFWQETSVAVNCVTIFVLIHKAYVALATPAQTTDKTRLNSNSNRVFNSNSRPEKFSFLSRGLKGFLVEISAFNQIGKHFVTIWLIRACSHDPGTTHCPGATH